MRIKAEIIGIDDLHNDLDKLVKNAEKLNGHHDVSLTDLLTDNFMQKHSPHKSVDEVFKASGYDIFGDDDLEEIPEEKLDAIVSKETTFSSWDEMITVAGEQYLEKQLFAK